MADDLALGDINLLIAGFGAMLAFLVGAACTAMLVNWGRRSHLRSEYTFPLLLEAALLVTFSLMGASLYRPKWLFISFVTLLLCFTMGLQNAIITKISHAEIRTTHVTGIVTDIGIELGKLFVLEPLRQPTGRTDGAGRQAETEAAVGADRHIFFGEACWGRWASDMSDLCSSYRWPPCCWYWWASLRSPICAKPMRPSCNKRR